MRLTRRGMCATDRGRVGEEKVAEWLIGHGIPADLQIINSPFDISCSGLRVEVKTARRKIGAPYGRKTHSWYFSFHRSGLLKEYNCDFYVLRMNDVPGEGAVHIVVPSPLERMGMSVTVNTLNGKWASFKDNLAPLIAAIEQKRTA